ncbi:MAG: MarR family transcriptional regulator [Ruminococcaceae bacterium]|nr:MarR family transcriptional regulator [Oscillospiraceae bacterium]
MAHIVRDMTYISRCGNHYRNEKLEPLGLTGRQAGSILVICNNPGISQDQLGKRVVLNKSNITRQLTFLEEKGYVNRVVSPTDKRVLQLYPTQKALDILPQIRQVYHDWRCYLLADISEEDQALLESLLERVKEKAYTWMDGGADL